MIGLVNQIFFNAGIGDIEVNYEDLKSLSYAIIKFVNDLLRDGMEEVCPCLEKPYVAYTEKTFPYGTMTWKPCKLIADNNKTVYRQGPYICEDQMLSPSSTLSSSCAKTLSLITGGKHTVVDERILEGGIELYGKNHLYNHRVVNTGRLISGPERVRIEQYIKTVIVSK